MPAQRFFEHSGALRIKSGPSCCRSVRCVIYICKAGIVIAVASWRRDHRILQQASDLRRLAFTSLISASEHVLQSTADGVYSVAVCGTCIHACHTPQQRPFLQACSTLAISHLTARVTSCERRSPMNTRSIRKCAGVQPRCACAHRRLRGHGRARIGATRFANRDHASPCP